MKTQDPNQDLQDGVDLARDVRPEPQRAPAPSHPRLCEAGPCRHYHRLEDQIDDGSTMSAPSFHIRVTHYCYPSPGIEMPLGALPVVRCNRWDPMVSEADVDRNRLLFADTPSGVAYATRVRAWEEERYDIVRAPDIWCGAPTMRGTTIKVAMLAWLAAGGESVARIAGRFSLSEDSVRLALEWAQMQPKEIT